MSVLFPLQRAAFALAALVLPAPLALAGGVRIVDMSGQLNFPDIQSAIDAAVDGDVLLVGAGSYPGFTLDGKGLSILAVTTGGPVGVSGAVEIRNVNGASRAVLDGLSISPGGWTVLRVHDNTGHVAFQDCSFTGGTPPIFPTGTTVYAAEVQSSLRVVLGGCVFIGGNGQWNHWPGWNGAAGIRLQASRVAAYGCTFRGGKGGNSGDETGYGGAGLRADQSWLFASGCSFTGGDSGSGITWVDVTFCGVSGNGLEVGAGTQAHLLDNAYAGGAPGNFCSPIYGTGGGIWSQGTVDHLPGAARTFDLASLSADFSQWSLSVAGTPGDQVFLNRSFAPVFQFEPTLSGVCTALLPPFAQAAPAGILPASGSLVVPVRQRLVPDDMRARSYFLQGYVIEPGGATVLGSPMHTLSLNWNSLPDCNGNGIQDYAEVIAGITPDVDHNLIPDGCP